MVIKFNDPFGSRKYAQLKGDKADSYFKISFSEGIFVKSEDGYHFFGQIGEYQGIVRSFKPENPITPGLCIVPFYSQEYEIRKKDKDGNWSSDKIQPSLFEKALCELISKDEDKYTSSTRYLKGQITHLPDTMLANLDDGGRSQTVLGNHAVEPIAPTGAIPEYTASTSGGQRRSFGGYKGVSMDERLAFIKAELVQSIEKTPVTASDSLGKLVFTFNSEHPDDEHYTQLYFDLLIAIVK